MKKLFSILFVLFSLTAFSQDIKVKQVIGAVRPFRTNVPVNGQSSFIPSWTWSLKTADAGMGYYDGKMLFYINDTLFAVGGYHGDSIPITTNKIFYSTNLGSSWSTYSVTWPYNIANVTSIKAKYPGDWNYVFGSTDLLGSNTRTVIRFKNFQQLYTMTTTAEYGVKFGFGATTDVYGNIYVIGGQTEKLEGYQTQDIWMSTAQSGGANWTKIQDDLTWLGGDVPNSVVERNGYIYIINARTTFNSTAPGHTYSNTVKKIAVENITDSSKWITVQSTPAYMDSMAYGTATVWKGNIVFGLGSIRNNDNTTNNTNYLGYLDNDDQWHYLHNYIGADSTAENGVLQPAHATTMIVIGESLITAFGAANSNVCVLKDSYILQPFTARQLSVTKDYDLSQNSAYETILGHNVKAGTPHISNSYMKRLTSEASSYEVVGRNGERWWGMLDDANATINTDVATTTGRKLYLKSNGELDYYTNAAQTNYLRIASDNLQLDFGLSSALRFKASGSNQYDISSGVSGDLSFYSWSINNTTMTLGNAGQLTISPWATLGHTTNTFDLQKGAVKLRSYGDGAITGTATYGAAFDVDGNLIEVALGGGGASAGFGLSGSFEVDSAVIATRWRLQHVIDSLGGLIGGGGGTPGGSNQEIQYNNSGAFGGAQYVKYDNSTGQLKLLGVEDGLYINNAAGGSYASMAIKGGSSSPFQFGQYNTGGVFFYNQGSGGYTFNLGANLAMNLDYLTAYARFPFGAHVGADATTSYTLGVTGTFGVSSTSELADNLKLAASKYLNWGTTFGSSGYGIRDNAGTMQFKNSGGSWADFGSGGSMVYPGAGIPVSTGSAWGTSIPSADFVLNNQANTYTAGMKQTFTADATNAGFKFGGVTANPSAPSGGDMWFRSDLEKLMYYDGAVVRPIVTESTSQTLTNKTINWTSNTNSLTLAQLNAAISSGGPVASLDGTETLNNKRINKRTGTTTSSATPTINTDNVDFYSITALATNITSFTTNLSGSPTEGQTLWIAITDNGTPRTLAFGTSFEASTVPLPTTTVASTRLDCLFVWNTVTSKWRIIACQ